MYEFYYKEYKNSYLIYSSNFIYIGMCIYAPGGIGFLVTNMQIGNMFPKTRNGIFLWFQWTWKIFLWFSQNFRNLIHHNIRAIVITIINGLFGSSSFIFLIFKWLYEGGMTLKMIFTIYTIISILCLRFKSFKSLLRKIHSEMTNWQPFFGFFRTFLFMPRRITPFDIPSDYKFGVLGKRFLIIIEINVSLLISYCAHSL